MALLIFEGHIELGSGERRRAYNQGGHTVREQGVHGSKQGTLVGNETLAELDATHSTF
jgi:hypothetical protein